MGEVDGIKHCETAPSEVFEKEVISHSNKNYWIGFETSAEVSSSSIWKHTTCATRVFISSMLLSRNFDNQLSSHSHRFVILRICWDTPISLDNNYQMCPVPLREKTSWDILDYSQGCCFLLVSPETEITILSFSSSLLAVSLRLTAGGRTDVFPSKPSGVSARSVAFREEKKLIKLLFPWNWWQFSIQFQI